MSRTMTARFAALPGTRAGAGRIGSRIVVADRPEGKAGGQGLGFNGGELFAAALGGCFWNDLHYAGERLQLALDEAEVTVEITLAGTPLRIVRARIEARLGAVPAAAQAIFAAAQAESTVANSVIAAIPITFALIA